MDRNRTIVVMSEVLFSYTFLKGIYCPSGIFLEACVFYAKHFNSLPLGWGDESRTDTSGNFILKKTWIIGLDAFCHSTIVCLMD